jgi:hypothetical protein
LNPKPKPRATLSLCQRLLTLPKKRKYYIFPKKNSKKHTNVDEHVLHFLGVGKLVLGFVRNVGLLCTGNNKFVESSANKSLIY